MIRFLPFGLLGVALLVLWVWAIFDVIATDSSSARNLPKVMWLVLVILVPTIGSIAWVLLGRPQRARFPAGNPGSRRPERQPGFKGTGPYRPDSASRYLGEHELTDRRSAELDAQLDEWERTKSNEESLRRRMAELDARQAELDARERALDEDDGENRAE